MECSRAAYFHLAFVVLSFSHWRQQGVKKFSSPELSPLVLPPLIYVNSLFSPAKFAKSNFQLIWRSQQQAQRA